MNKKTFKIIKQTINKANSIALFCHIDPDFDCLCSMYALREGLVSLGKTVSMFTHEKFAKNQKAMLDESLVKIGGFNPDKFDLIMTVDTPSLDRLGAYGDAISNHNNIIKIDHHASRGDFANISFVATNRSSCCEIIYDLLKYLKVKLTPNLASIIYCGVFSDTNSFMNTNTNLDTLQTALELYKAGADFSKASEVNTKMKTMAELDLKKTFYKNIEIVNKELAISTISLDELKNAKATKQDTEGFSSELLSYNGVNISCCMTQKEDNIFSCSLRSMEGYDVSIIAEAFNGGGHVCASGCKIKAKTMEEAKKMFIKEAKAYLKKRVSAND